MYVKYRKPDFLNCFVASKKIRENQKKQQELEELERMNRYSKNQTSRMFDLSIDVDKSITNLKK